MKNQRAELSTKNKYWIPKYRYLELKNFCLQYPEWKQELSEISVLKSISKITPSGNFSDPTCNIACKIISIKARLELIDHTAVEADDFLAKWIIKGVTENISYEFLHLQLDMPTSRDTYYDRYRRFFWLLDKKRN